MWWIILIIVVVLIIAWAFATYNKLVDLRNRVKDQWAQIDVQLKRRFDLIPNLVETVKGYAKHEKDTLTEVIHLRSSYDSLSDKEKLDTNEQVSSGITKIMALAESYPELKADKNFLNLSTKLSDVEDEIAKSRRYYNAVVRMYNNKVEMIPSNIVAKIFGYKQKNMFEAEAEERENVDVKL